VEPILTNDGEAILRPVSKSVDELFGKFKNKSKRSFKHPVSVKDMDLAIRNRIKAQYKENSFFFLPPQPSLYENEGYQEEIRPPLIF